MPKKIFYAIEAVLYIAYNSKAKPISSRDIASRHNLPARYLEQIMQKLVHNGVLRGVRGPSGGYLLAKERRKIFIADICNAIAEPDNELEEVKTSLGKGLLLPLCEEIKHNTMSLLMEKNLADMCERAKDLGIKNMNDESENYNI